MDNISKADFRSGASCIEHNNTLRIILKKHAEFRFPFELPLIGSEKGFRQRL